MGEKRWKTVERRVAKYLGGTRAGAVGKEGPDVIHSWLAPEVKSRENFPKWLKDAMGQAEENAGAKFPIVILQELGDRVEDTLVIMRMARFKDILERMDNGNKA